MPSRKALVARSLLFCATLLPLPQHRKVHRNPARVIALETSPLGHRLGLASLTDGTVPPLPFQLAPLSSSRAKQLAWCSSGAADCNVFLSGFFVDFRVRMQPQTMNAVTIAQKTQSCICGIVVFSAAQHHYQPL